MSHFIGVDIGGTSVNLGLFNERMELLGRGDALSMADTGSGDELVERLAGRIDALLASRALERGDLASVGLGCPGPLDSMKGVILETPNIPFLWRYPLSESMLAKLHCPVALDNDANLFALGEAIGGAGKGLDYVIGVTLGTGFGFGIVLNGRVYRGATGTAAEYGLTPWTEGGELWEDTVSASGVVKAYHRLGGKAATALQVYELAEDGDENAQAVWQRYGKVLGLSLVHVVNLLDPHMVVVGGEMAGAWSQFHAAMERSLKEYIFELPAAQLQVVPAKLGSDAPLLGAAAMAAALPARAAQ
ncbi:MAG: ROK family protein [Candidatus Marinimicrobia bacterium]|nr:ROK family protein [Candidatus Neomarinimicrobiota bacterium]